MRNILSLMLLVLPILFYCQNLDIKILQTDVINQENIKIKILIENNSNNTFEYNSGIEIKDIEKSILYDFTNIIAFYKNDEWINVPTMHYGKDHIKKNSVLKIKPYSKKSIIINLKRNLSKERKRGLYLTLHLLDLKKFNYNLLLFFKDSKNNSYEKYKLSSEINMEQVSN